MPSLRIPIAAAALVAAAATAPTIVAAQDRSDTCIVTSTAQARDSAAPAVVPRNLEPLLRPGSRTAGSVRFAMVYEPAYPKGPLILRRTSRPVYTQRAGIGHTTGWVQASPKSSRWFFVPVPSEPPPLCPARVPQESGDLVRFGWGSRA